ncbi:hypothetical protein [Bacillus cihuensis]|uniref:hypothetical protein n=1 Tax=Bacillus cihuensis TaxID=1208599 RepID=UPI00048B3F3E|nr:hypothetical protein [Bacillus cihuensis]
MKKILLTCIIFLLTLALSACSTDEKTSVKQTNEVKVKTEDSVANSKEAAQKDKEQEKLKAEAERKIDTSIFEYAKQIEVTDAIDINQHVTVVVTMDSKTPPGLATQHVVNQTYDFLQQDDIKDAKTISINVKQGEQKIAMFSVNKDEFKPNDDEPMSDLVMAASTMEFMTPEVKEFGETMDSW